jgi:hypothetical protein
VHDRHLDGEQFEQRSPGPTVANGSVTGATSGVAGAVPGHVIGPPTNLKVGPPPPSKS